MNRSNSQTVLTENSLFYKKKQESFSNHDHGLDFEMEWDPDTKLYTPPKISPSVFQFKPSINKKEEDEVELMSVDEIQKQIQNNITNNNSTVNNNNNSNNNSNNNNSSSINSKNDNNSVKSEDFDLNKISFDSNNNEINNNNNNNLHTKVKKKSIFGMHHFGGLNTSSETQKKLYLTKHSRLSHLNFNNNNNPFSTNNNSSYFYNNNNNNHHHHDNHISPQQHQYLSPLQPQYNNHNSNENLQKKIEWYSQYIVRIVLVSFSFFIIYLTFNAIVNDVNLKYIQHSSEIQKEVEKCVKSYNENRCAPITRIPAMEKQCTEWELCMEKDPTKLPKTRIFAEILSEVLESFVSTMSYKTMAFLICTIWIMIWIPNKILESRRNSNNNSNNSHHNSNHQIQHQSQPTQSFFAKNLFTIDQGFSKNLENRLLDEDDDN